MLCPFLVVYLFVCFVEGEQTPNKEQRREPKVNSTHKRTQSPKKTISELLLLLLLSLL